MRAFASTAHHERIGIRVCTRAALVIVYTHEICEYIYTTGALVDVGGSCSRIAAHRAPPTPPHMPYYDVCAAAADQHSTDHNNKKTAPYMRGARRARGPHRNAHHCVCAVCVLFSLHVCVCDREHAPARAKRRIVGTDSVCALSVCVCVARARAIRERLPAAAAADALAR